MIPVFASCIVHLLSTWCNNYFLCISSRLNCREIWLVWCLFMRIFELLKTLKVVFEVNYPLILIQIYIFGT